ncbi:hypothetical protein K6U06_08550 [Acidiferrimicrobium sp. IK]|uniref:hypothetical protein n=1 Tax=Acidiferrimicrobium sp. IK TaxID=2871700 RepID=UPI0021CB1DFE|nr:hypothetical protein [Acidiferrimicrobium sp. IK]MCU4184409.1 hypothetical protein [Acidiferrimicrobium sp. IK]
MAAAVDPRRLTLRALAVTVAVLAVLGTTGVGLSRIRLDTTIASFLPGGDRTVRTLNAEQTAFGADPIALLLTSKQPVGLLSGTPLRDEIALESKLASLPDVAVVYGPGTTLNEITISLQNVLVDISGKRDALIAQAEQAAKAAGQPPAAQQAAGKAAVAQFDLRYGALLAKGLRIGLPSIQNTALGKTVFLGADGQAQPAFRWLVPDATHESILVRPSPGLSQARTEALVRELKAAVKAAKLPISASVVTGTPVIVAAFGTEITTELPILAGISLAVVAVGFLVVRRRRPVWERLLPLGIGFVATGITMSAFGWLGASLSLGLLAFLPIILGVGTDYPIYALRQGRPRLILATATASAASLALLAVNPLPYVRDLGIALAAGLLLSAVLGVAVARRLPPLPARETDRRDRCSAGRQDPPSRPRRRPAWAALGALGAVVALGGWAALGTLGLNSDPERLAAGLPALEQGLAAQSVLGASGELDVYVRGADVMTPAFLSWYQQAQDRLLLAHGDQLRPIVSPATLLSWLGDHPTPAQITAADEVLPAYLTDAAIRTDHKQAVMAFGVQLGSLGSESALIASIRHILPPAPAGATVSITGLPAVGARSYDLLSGDRLLPNAGGIAAFGAVLVVFLRRRRTAVLAVLAAVLAAGWGFALLRLTHTPLTPLTVSLGSLTSAVGGEFTVMAASASRAGRSRPWSAVIGAGATSLSGFAVLGLSHLAILRQFGIVLAGSVGLALVAAWVVVSVDNQWRQPRQVPSGESNDRPIPARQEILV